MVAANGTHDEEEEDDEHDEEEHDEVRFTDCTFKYKISKIYCWRCRRRR